MSRFSQLLIQFNGCPEGPLQEATVLSQSLFNLDATKVPPVDLVNRLNRLNRFKSKYGRQVQFKRVSIDASSSAPVASCKRANIVEHHSQKPTKDQLSQTTPKPMDPDMIVLFFWLALVVYTAFVVIVTTSLCDLCGYRNLAIIIMLTVFVSCQFFNKRNK